VSERRVALMMRMRSTGLGATELIGEISDLERVGDYLILHVNTTEPVRWHLRTAMNFRDMMKVTKMMFKPSNLLFLITHLFYNPKEEKPIEF